MSIWANQNKRIGAPEETYDGATVYNSFIYDDPNDSYDGISITLWDDRPKNNSNWANQRKTTTEVIFLTTENGVIMMTEDGDNIILEQGLGGDTIWANQIKN